MEHQQRLEDEQHGPAVNEGVNVEHNPPPQLQEQLPPPQQEGHLDPVEEAGHNALMSNQADNSQLNLSHRLPQPTVEGFSYLPSHYEMPPFEDTENEDADGIAKRVEEFFIENVLNPRLRIDTDLKRFKELTKQGEDGPLPACFAVWKDMAVKDNFILQQDHEEVFRVECNDNIAVKEIVVNADRVNLTEEVNVIGDQMKKLLTACHNFLAEKENVNHRLHNEMEEFRKIHIQTLKTDKTLRKIESLPLKMEKHCAQVANLLQDIKAAVSSKHLTAHRVKQRTGLITLVSDAR